MTRPASTPARLVLGVACTGAVLHAALVLVAASVGGKGLRFTLFDDAMISMGYARTLAETGEFVWFAGAPRVQGITNPLWAGWMALVHFVGFGGNGAALAVIITGIVLLLLLAVATGLATTAVLSTESGSIGMIAAGATVLCLPTVYWTLRGMEVGLIALLGVAVVLLLVLPTRRDTLRTVLIAATCLAGVATRFDFTVIAVGASVGLVLAQRRMTRGVGATLVATAAGASLVLLCQRAYYGSALPNTYMLKMSGTNVWTRCARGLLASGKLLPVLFLVGLCVVVVARSDGGTRRSLVYVCATAFFSMCAYAVYTGGDAWENDMMSRFHASVLPLTILAVSASFGDRSVIRRLGRLRLVVPFTIVPATFAAALTVNPTGFSVARFVPVLLSTTAASAAFMWACSRKVPRGAAASIVPVVLAAVSMVPLAAGSAGVWMQIHARDPLLTRTNHHVAATAATLSIVTSDSAVIATVWAGLPAYQSRRRMIDILGKNDPVIASMERRADFFPGHDKWDYVHSVRSQSPDVVYQVFSRDPDEDVPALLGSWGYVRRCTDAGPFARTGAWFLSNSANVRWDLLTAC